MIATLKDIAQDLKLSVNTVSRALRDMPDISQDTKLMVREAAERLGYRKNMAASRLRTNRSQIIGLIVADIADPVSASFAVGAEKVCKLAGFTIMMGSSHASSEAEAAIAASMLEHGIDGILIVPTMSSTQSIDMIRQAGLPFVIIGHELPDIAANVVKSNDFDGAAKMSRYLYGLGHRKFLCLDVPGYLGQASERLEGFRSGLRHASLTNDTITVLSSDGTQADAYLQVTQWLAPFKVSGKLDATALFCSSDYVAFGALQALKAGGYKIPDDISVVGFDNNDFSEMITPPLTTVDIRKNILGERSARRLIELISDSYSNSKNHPGVLTFTPELIVRQSAGKPRH